MDVPAIAMPFELGLGDIDDNMVFKCPGRFEIGVAAMRALLGMNVMLDELGAGGRLGSEDTGVLAMLLPTTVVRSALPRRAFGLGAFVTLQERLDLVLQLRDPLAQLGVFGFEFRNPKVARVVHDRVACQER